jgi:cytochrome P450
MAQALPSTDLDMFGDEVLSDPYRFYRTLRDIGPAVRLDRYDGVLAITRYDDVKRIALDWQSFTSKKGVSFNRHRNEVAANSVLMSDPPEHKHLRGIILEWLSAKRVRQFRDEIEGRAEALVDELVARGSFDAVTDLAEALPALVVGEMVGLPRELRNRLLEWGEANFDSAGPDNERTRRSAEVADSVYELLPNVTKADVSPSSVSYELLTSVEEGRMTLSDAMRVMVNLSVPSIDTTISGIATAVHQLGLAPEQWRELRENPALVPQACEEALRFEAPAQVFGRVATVDYPVGNDAIITAGSRVALYYGSANRDERHYSHPDRFDLHRDASDHLAFGHGLHHCVGAPLARIEITAAVAALVKRVRTFEVGAPKRRLNNVTRRLASLPMSVSS